MQNEILVRLVQEYQQDIYRFCLQLTQNKIEAEDLFQDAFLKAVQLRHKLDDGDINSQEVMRRNRNYIMGIAANLWKNKYRVEQRRKQLIPQCSYEEQMVEPRSEENLENDMIKQEAISCMRRQAAKLPEKYQIVISMFYTVQMSVEEISHVLHIPKGTVKSRLHNARKQLREGMEAEGYEIEF